MTEYAVHEDPSGVVLGASYDTDTTPYTLVDVRVLDAQYRAVGPNLVHMLDSHVVVTTAADGVLDAQPFLNTLIKDIHGRP